MLATPADVRTLTNDDLLTNLTGSHDEMARHKARFLLSLAEFDARGLARRAGAASTRSWLARRLDVSDKTAYEYLGVSRTLAEFPAVAAAFADGDLSYSKVRLLGKHLTEDNQHEVLALALSLPHNELKLALAGRDAADADPRPREDSFRLWVDDDTGRYRFSGDLSPALGAAFAAALKIGELATLRDLKEFAAADLADDATLDRLIDNAADEDPSQTRFGPPQRSTLLSALTGMINLTRSSTHSAARAPGAQVHVMVTEDGHAFMPLNPGAPAAAVTDLLADAEFRGHLLDGKGVTMKMGRKHRLVSDGQATALLARWMFQCATPGCSHARFLEFHHLTEYSVRGFTDVDNLLPLCSACHSLVTNGVTRIEVDAIDTDVLRFTFPDGSTYESRRRGLPRKADPRDPSWQEPPTAPSPPLREWGDSPWLSFEDDDPADSARAEKSAASPTT